MQQSLQNCHTVLPETLTTSLENPYGDFVSAAYTRDYIPECNQTVKDYFTQKYLLENGFQEGRSLHFSFADHQNLKKPAAGRIGLMFVDEASFNYRGKELGYGMRLPKGKWQ